jgi:hypothetical protein
MMIALFNLSQDVLEDIPLTLERMPAGIEMLNADGERVACEFTSDGNTVRIVREVGVLEPVILFIK